MVLIIDDVDVPLPRPSLHTVAVIEPGVAQVDTGALQPGAAGMRFIPGDFEAPRIRGPASDSDHGPHRYRFHLFALDQPVPEQITSAKALLKQMAGHVLARGVLTGTYERP